MTREEKFAGRFSGGTAWEEKLRERFAALGFHVIPFGQHFMISTEAQELIHPMNDSLTAKFIRYLPDMIIFSPDRSKCWLVEAKSLMRHDTDSFSYELACYDADRSLEMHGVNVIAAFEGWKADFVKNLRIHAHLDMPSYLRGTQGSRTAFGLIKKDSVPGFDEFVAGLTTNLADFI